VSLCKSFKDHMQYVFTALSKPLICSTNLERKFCSRFAVITNQMGLTGLLHLASVADLLHLAFLLVHCAIYASCGDCQGARYLTKLNKAEHLLQTQ